MFKIQPNPTFTAIVKIPVAGEPSADLSLIFKHKTRDDMADYFARTAKSRAKDAALMMEIVAGWNDVDAEFSEKTLGSLIQNYHGAVKAIFDTYVRELTLAKEGN